MRESRRTFLAFETLLDTDLVSDITTSSTVRLDSEFEGSVDFRFCVAFIGRKLSGFIFMADISCF